MVEATELVQPPLLLPLVNRLPQQIARVDRVNYLMGREGFSRVRARVCVCVSARHFYFRLNYLSVASSSSSSSRGGGGGARTRVNTFNFNISHELVCLCIEAVVAASVNVEGKYLSRKFFIISLIHFAAVVAVVSVVSGTPAMTPGIQLVAYKHPHNSARAVLVPSVHTHTRVSSLCRLCSLYFDDNKVSIAAACMHALVRLLACVTSYFRLDNKRATRTGDILSCFLFTWSCERDDSVYFLRKQNQYGIA